jgi:hypothetical protein
MSNENKSIHEFDFSLICEYFSNIERQGPGSPEVTLKALSFINNLTCESTLPTLVVEPVVKQWCWRSMRQDILQVSTYFQFS